MNLQAEDLARETAEMSFLADDLAREAESSSKEALVLARAAEVAAREAEAWGREAELLVARDGVSTIVLALLAAGALVILVGARLVMRRVGSDADIPGIGADGQDGE
ncbi:MAG: hypothetical protein OXS33_05290 [bacterium]|nr:hypothetical protein [bacterium]